MSAWCCGPILGVLSVELSTLSMLHVFGVELNATSVANWTTEPVLCKISCGLFEQEKVNGVEISVLEEETVG